MLNLVLIQDEVWMMLGENNEVVRGYMVSKVGW